MSALLRQIQSEHRRVAESWRSGFMVGCVTVFLILAPVVGLVLILAKGCRE